MGAATSARGARPGAAVPERIKKPGRRGRPEADEIGGDQPEAWPNVAADQNHEPIA